MHSGHSERIHSSPARPVGREKKTVVLLCRASSPEQEQGGNLNDQVDDAIQQLQAMGIKWGHGLVGVVRGVESSRIEDDRPLLERASKMPGYAGPSLWRLTATV